jgi:hypothetical protein
MVIYRERVLVMLELAIDDLQQGLLFVPTVATCLSAAQAGQPVNHVQLAVLLPLG